MNWLRLIGFIVLSEAAGIAGSVFTAPAIGSWYATLTRPMFSPPNWIFAPVWTTLYFLMGIAAFLVWKQHSHTLESVRVLWARRIGLVLFFVQLALNVLWSVLFFGLHSPLAGLVCIALLWLAILAMIVFFARVSKPAAWLLAPYIAWVSFAAYLNYAIWILN